jgi:N-acetylglucosaminyldiphosphoundecaprenol N-acetyl-beta-D-mannosaminyltransferase
MATTRAGAFNGRMTPFSPTFPTPRRWVPPLRRSWSHAPAPAALETRWPVAVLGVPFHALTSAEALECIDAMIASRRPHQIVTANVDFLVQARHDCELRRILLEADLVLCDGAPVRWASRLLGNPLPERVTGSDLVPALLAAAETRGHRIFLLGAAPGVAAQAAARIAHRWPRAQVVGHYSPPLAPLLEMDHEEIVRRVRDVRPDVLLVSFGCPKQEKWIAMHLATLEVPVVIGVGATIDFLAGRVRRAPAWMQRSGTEWLFRLAQEPARLHRRYRANVREFFPALARQLRDFRACAAAAAVAPTAPSLRFQPGWLEVDPGSHLTRAAMDRHARFWSDTLPADTSCVLDLARLRALDGTGLAFLVQWRRSVRAAGGRLVLLQPPPAVLQVLRSAGLADVFLVAPTAIEAQQWLAGTRDEPPVSCDTEAGLVRWHGEILAANARQVWRLTVQFLFALGVRRPAVVIDLSDVRYLDSTAVQLMLRLREAARAQFGYEALFIGARPVVRNVLQLAGVAPQILPPA